MSSSSSLSSSASSSTQFAASKFSLAGVRFGQTLQPDFVDFLTTLCYNDIVTIDPSVAPGRKAHL